jgi:hypothetical protein
VIDPDTTNPVKVHVYVGDIYRGEFDADVSRPDVAAAYPGYGPVRGFDVTVPVAAGLQQVAVYAINVGGGQNRLVGARMVVVGGNPHGSVDSATGQSGGVRVSGWALDPDTAAPTKVHVYVDDVYRGEFDANESRPDVGAAFPGYGSNHGFTATVPAPSGTRRVCVYAINIGAGGNNLISCRTVNVP